MHTACIEYYGMCMCITLLLSRCSCTCTLVNYHHLPTTFLICFIYISNNSPRSVENAHNTSNSQVNAIAPQSPNTLDLIGSLQSQILGLQTQTLQQSTLNPIKIFNGTNKSEFTLWMQSVENTARLCNLDTLNIALSKLQGPPLKSTCYLESKETNSGKTFVWSSLKKKFCTTLMLLTHMIAYNRVVMSLQKCTHIGCKTYENAFTIPTICLPSLLLVLIM